VASQTIENLASVEAVATMPVLRPLIAYDKHEIISVARHIGTYEISIQPHEDCCAFLMPDHPATRSRVEDLAAAERKLDVAELVRQVIDAAELCPPGPPAPWHEIPAPAGAAE
jgi:thiamine biosynthesis protein ThiI